MKRFLFYSVILTVLPVSAASVPAVAALQNLHLTDCGRLHGPMAEIECHQANVKRLDKAIKRLAKQLPALDKQIGLTDAAQSWQKSQALWQNFIRHDCRLDAVSANLTQGTGYGKVYHACIAERYALRHNQLRKVVSELYDLPRQ